VPLPGFMVTLRGSALIPGDIRRVNKSQKTKKIRNTEVPLVNILGAAGPRTCVCACMRHKQRKRKSDKRAAEQTEKRGRSDAVKEKSNAA
jgi:hypothetical protein